MLNFAQTILLKSGGIFTTLSQPNSIDTDKFSKLSNRKSLESVLQTDGSNTDGSFTMANSNSFLSPYEILPIAQENKYLRKFSYFIVKLYVVCTH